MKRKLFQKYEYEFDKNERKILSSFSKQVIKQMESDDKFARELRVFNSIQSKLEEYQEKIKFTKEEKTKLSLQLSENVNFLENKVEKSWWLMKWFYKNMLNQYQGILYKFSE
jgi:hypothetical protein